MNEEIPAYAYIEAQVIHRAANNQALEASARVIEKQYDLPEGFLGSGIFSQTRILSLLYTLIVVPKEFWKLDEKDPVYSTIEELWLIDSVDVITDNSRWEKPVYSFIHHLRNSVSHANFSFEKDYFEFWNQYKNRPESYRARISTEALIVFLERVGSILANLKNTRTKA